MKYIILPLLLLVGILNAEESKHLWLQHWTQGLQHYQQGNYSKAVQEYTAALDDLGNEETSKHLYIYNERGKALFKQGQYQNAVADFSTVITKTNKHAKGQLSDRVTALWGRSSCYALLNNSEKFRADYELLRTCDTHFPKVELWAKYLVIRNVDFKTMSPEMRAAFCCALVHAEMCVSPSDVTFFDEGICVVKRLCHCGCKSCFEREKYFTCTHCKQSFLRQACEGAAPDSKVRCIEVAKTAFILSASLPRFACHAACIAVAESLIQSCFWQCDSTDFYERCVTPFLYTETR